MWKDKYYCQFKNHCISVDKIVPIGVTSHFLHHGHLGNINYQVNTSNAVVAEYSFDACSVKLAFCKRSETKSIVERIPISEADREGRRRNATNWTYTLDANDKALFADRGFTGHEYLPWFKLYNMNGRMYDPAVGRFLSADIVVQDPGNTQSYNRYSYCLNNPLKYTDPSGYTWLSQFTNWVGEGFSNAWDWMNKHPMEFGVSSGGPNGPTYFVKIPGKTGNPGVAVGFNPDKRRVGVGNNSSGFMQFNFPGYNYDVAAQNFVNNTLPNVRAQYGDEWHGRSGGARVFVEMDGIGHAYIEINGTVFTYGRYNGSYSPSSGRWGPVGDGILNRLKGHEAQDFIKDRIDKYPTNIYEINSAYFNANDAYQYLTNKYWSGSVTDNVGRRIDTYFLIGNNCSTFVSSGLSAGGLNVYIGMPYFLDFYLDYYSH